MGYRSNAAGRSSARRYASNVVQLTLTYMLQQNMFCHNVAGHSICCEGSGTARAELDDEDGPKNPLKYRPEEADKVKETLKVLEEIEKAVLTAKPEQSTEPPASADESTAPASVTDDTVQATEGKRHYADSDNDALPAAGGPETTATESTQPSRQYADNEGAFFTVEKQTTKRPKQRKIKDSQVTGPAKAQAAKLHPQEAGPPAATYDGIEYRPHALGGYAVSKKLHGTNLKAPRPEKKALVQQFLLDQIKDGECAAANLDELVKILQTTLCECDCTLPL